MRGNAFQAEGIAYVKARSRKRIGCWKTWFAEFTGRQCAGCVGSEGPAAGRRAGQVCPALSATCRCIPRAVYTISVLFTGFSL